MMNPSYPSLQASPARRFARNHPVLAVIGIEVFYVAAVVALSTALAVLLPDLPGYSVTGPSQSLLLVLLAAAALLAGIAAFRAWKPAGFTNPAQWRSLGLYLLPVLLLAVPFVGGFRPVALDTLGMLLLAYAATAVFEEGLWRGAMLGLLRPRGIWHAVIISSVLFGLGHLGNSALRGVSPIIAAQAFGAAVGGVGYAALRLRTNTIWPLIAIHLLHDLFLQMSPLPIPLLEVPIDTILLVYGIYLLRRGLPEETEQAEPAPLPVASVVPSGA